MFIAIVFRYGNQSSAMKTKHLNTKPILYYDGQCKLCNQAVQFLLKHAKNQQLLFAPLQGSTARDNLDQQYVEKMTTVVLTDQDGLHTKSTAILRAYLHINGQAKGIAKMLLWVPEAIRDAVYKLISLTRYRIFGRTSCPIVKQEQRSQFLD